MGFEDLTAGQVAMLVLYFAPACVAALRKHHQQNAIFVLNFLLGWTVLGWIGAMVWAATATQGRRRFVP
jgi:ABC-type transport system involved in cytochrome c biogenesis permease component